MGSKKSRKASPAVLKGLIDKKILIQYEEEIGRISGFKGDPKKLPELQFETKNFYKYNVNDFKLVNYEHHEKIDASMNV